jgi:energy-converting hydrogenase Eha subunit B
VGALVVAAVVTLFGAAAGWVAAGRLALLPAATRGQWLARTSVSLLGAFAGGLIASQLYDLVHRLQLNAKLDGGFGGRFQHEINALDVVHAVSTILFDGALLIGLATAVALIARRGATRASIGA